MWQYKDQSIAFDPDNVDKDKVWGYTKTNYVTPKLVQNLSGNNDFKSTSGWDCHVVAATGKDMAWADDNLNSTADYRGEIVAQGA
jgi:hypothetical protein